VGSKITLTGKQQCAWYRIGYTEKLEMCRLSTPFQECGR
jgi:hypothetical protein